MSDAKDDKDALGGSKKVDGAGNTRRPTSEQAKMVDFYKARRQGLAGMVTGRMMALEQGTEKTDSATPVAEPRASAGTTGDATRITDILDKRSIADLSEGNAVFVEVKKGESLNEFAMAVLKRSKGNDYKPSPVDIAMVVEQISRANDLPKEQWHKPLAQDMDIKIPL